MICKNVFIAAALAAFVSTVEAVELEKWTFSSEKDVKRVQNYFNSKNACKITQRFDPAMKFSKESAGSYCFEIIQRGRIFADITPIFVCRHDLKKDKHYTLSLVMRADRNLDFPIVIAQNHPDWKSAFSYPCKLVANRWQKITFQFQPKFDLPGKRSSRTPVLYLGDKPNGTKLWIASVTLSEED